MRKVFTRKQPILYLVRSCSSLLFGKCGRYASKIISLFLVLVTFISFSIPTFASEDTTIDTVDLPFEAYAYHSTGSDNVTDLVNVSTVTSSTFKGMLKFQFPLSTDFNYIRTQAALQLFDNYDFNSNHEYTISFDYGFNISLPFTLEVGLYFYNAKGEIIKQQQIADIVHVKTDSQKVHNLNVSFKPDINDLGSGYTTKMIIQFYQNGYNSSTIYQIFYISQQISLIDKDDNSSWFQKIINKINELWETVKTIPDKISSKINELGASISLIITNLKNNLIDGIKNLFIPDEEYLQNKKDELVFFCTNHFGAIYQSLEVFSDFLNMLINISPTEPKITFPAIDIPLFDNTYHLSDEVVYSFSWVNDKTHFLYYIYNFYRSFVTVLLFLPFINYCRNKYAEVFGGDKD